MSKLGLAMIVKDEDKELEKLFESCKGVFDEILVAVNGTNPATREICARFGARVVEYAWDDNFANARNHSFAHSSADFIMWLDADDTLVNAGELRATLGNAFSDPEVNIVEMPYHYDHDEYGNVTMKLWNGRVIRKGTFEWRGAIHECLLPVVDFKKCRIENVFVNHNVDPERVKRSAERNLRICKKEYEREHKDGGIDPRTTLYYAKALNGAGFFKEAVEVFEEYLEQSEWDDEKYEVLCTLADFHTRSRQYFKAQDFARRAVTLRPLYGQAYFELAEVFYRMEKYEECLHFVQVGMDAKCPEAIIPVDPSEYKFRPLVLAEFALFQLGRTQECLATIEAALKLQPKNEHLLARRSSVIGFIARMELEKSSITLLKWLTQTEPDKLRPFLDALPEVVRDHPDFVRLANGFKRLDGQANRLVIYCGPTFETWNPNTAKTQGLGGSEEAVVYLSRELVKQGWIVDVYNNCDQPGVHDGVEYHNFWEHDPKMPCDIFIAWRNSEYVLQAPEGSRVFVWLHDVQRPEYWTPERVARTEKIIVLSKHHRTYLPEVAEDKFFYSRNGIIPAQFAGVGALSRDPLKCIYASSPDRGLDILLEMWPEIYKASKEQAHLHVFYGFSKTFDLLHKDHEAMMEFKERVLKMLQQPGVHYHGKVPHAELHEHMMTAGLWLYPTHFTEISCITAMKAQVAGAIPVTMTLAALDETVQHGYKISFGIQDTRSRKAFINIASDLLTDPAKQEKIRKPMMEWARDFYDWKRVGQEWTELFKAAPVKA